MGDRMQAPNHLEKLLESNDGATHMQVVFLDIEKYSRRNSRMQSKVIAKFTDLIRSTLEQFVGGYIRGRVGLKDIITVPTGDGALIVLTAPASYRSHFDLALVIVREIHLYNSTEDNWCSTLGKNGWCNCHDTFRVRVGVSDGPGIVYRDLNENYNVAGSVVNIAARVMGLGDGMQILLSSSAYDNLIDMTDDYTLESKFRLYEDMEVKHGIEMSVYQYCPGGDQGINSNEPTELTARIRRGEEARVLRGEVAVLKDELDNQTIEVFTKLAQEAREGRWEISAPPENIRALTMNHKYTCEQCGRVFQTYNPLFAEIARIRYECPDCGYEAQVWK